MLSTLQVQRVEALLIPERSSLTAHLCPRCGRLSATDSGACPFDGAILGQVDPIAHAIEQAARQSADVVVIHHETDSLTKHGHIAALLRW